MKLNSKRVAILCVALILGCVIILRIAARKPGADADTTRPQTAAVVLAERGPLVNSLTLSGTFRPFQEVDVHAKVAGYVRQIFVDVGDKVKEGQVLAILEIPELNAEVLGAKASIRRGQDAITRAESEVQRAQSTYAAAHFAYTRLKQASDARPGLIAEQELDDAMAKDKESEAQVSSARAALAEANSSLAVFQSDASRLDALAAYSHIVAPFAGVVTKRYADTGSLIQAGTSSNTQAMPVVQLAEWAKLRLVLPVPESAVPDVHLGSAVEVRVPALQRSFTGKVARFADALDAQTRTMQTEIDFPNLDNTLVDGMYAETTLTLLETQNALTVPIQAVQRTESGGQVLIVDRSGRIEERDVTLGQEGSNRVQILSGLQERDQVVIGNRSLFKPGQTVQPKVVDEKSGAEGIS
jgi:RND family efflux transporter MFP subunit